MYITIVLLIKPNKMLWRSLENRKVKLWTGLSISQKLQIKVFLGYEMVYILLMVHSFILRQKKGGGKVLSADPLIWACLDWYEQIFKCTLVITTSWIAAYKVTVERIERNRSFTQCQVYNFHEPSFDFVVKNED